MKLLRLLLIVTVLLAAYLAALATYFIPCAWIFTALLVFKLLAGKRTQYFAYGTARWASVFDLVHMLDGSGLIIGHLPGKLTRAEGLRALFTRWMPSRYAVRLFLQTCQGIGYKPKNLVRLTDACHIMVAAPTGVGKGVSCVLPFLLTCRESCVVVDFKGENYEITSDARKRMGHRVVRLDPFGVCGKGGDTLNILDSIDPESPAAIDDCRAIAESIVIRTGQERDPHWCDAAEFWIAAMTAAVVAYAEGEERHLQSVRALLTNPAKMEAAIEMMCASDKWDGMLSRMGEQLKHFKDKEFASTLTSTNKFMRFLDTARVSENTEASSFNPADLLKGRKMTVYLILPPEYQRTQSPLLRLWIGAFLRAAIKGGLQEKNKVHFVCDEANSLGKMDQISDVLTIGRGYGIRMQLYYQDLGQLRKCWPDGADQTLLANTTQVFFGVNDQQTAEYISNRLGERTIVINSGGKSRSSSRQGGGGSTSPSYSVSRTASDNWQQLGRKLLKPEEVTALDQRMCITFAPGVLPIATWLVRYYEKSFNKPQGMGFLKAAVDTACLFVIVAALAAGFTVAIFSERPTGIAEVIYGEGTVQRWQRSATYGRYGSGGRGHQGHRPWPIYEQNPARHWRGSRPSSVARGT